MMMLYDAYHLAECYAVRLMAALLGKSLPVTPLDIYHGRDNCTPEFLALNPAGTLPVLIDGAHVLTDWQAILVHLAHGSRWLPDDKAALALWLDRAQALRDSAGLARMIATFGAIGDGDAARTRADRLLDTIEREVWFAERAGHAWLIVGEHPGIADVACYAFIAPCEAGGLGLRDRPALRRWCDRVRFLPGFVAMGGIFAPMANTAPVNQETP